MPCLPRVHFLNGVASWLQTLFLDVQPLHNQCCLALVTSFSAVCVFRLLYFWLRWDGGVWAFLCWQRAGLLFPEGGGFSLRELALLQRLSAPGLSSCGFQAPERRLSNRGAPAELLAARGISPAQGSNLCLWHRQKDSVPLNHQGSPGRH